MKVKKIHEDQNLIGKLLFKTLNYRAQLFRSDESLFRKWLR
jgi:hypothetical protein